MSCCGKKASLWRFLHTTPPSGHYQAVSKGKEAAMDTEKVLDEYRNGDDGKRLSLFLTYRELRDQFCTIDQECSHDDFAIIRFPWSRKHPVAKAA
jgi:hypothetical protein